MKNSFYLFCAFLLLGMPLKLHAQKNSTTQTQLNQGKELLFYGKYDQASKIFQKILITATASNNAIEIAAAYNGLAKTYTHQAKLRQALDYAKKALEYSGKNKETGKLQEATALENLSVLFGIFGDSKIALKNSNEALEIRKKYFKDDKLSLARSHFYVGLALHRDRKLKLASKKLETALSIDLETSVERTILYADIYETQGHLCYDLGQINKTLALFEKTLALAQKVYPKNNPYYGKVYNNLGLIYATNKRFNESLEYYHKALSISIQNHGLDNHDEQVRINFNIADIYMNLGIKDKAFAYTYKTIELGTKFYGADHPKMHYPYSMLGTIYGDERGIPDLEKALSICLNAKEVNYVIAGFLYEYIYNIYFKVENYKDALINAEKSLEIRRRIHGLQNVNTIRTYNDIAKTKALLNDFENAFIANEKALTYNKLINTTNDNRFSNTNYVNSELLLESLKTKGDILFLQFLNTNNVAYLRQSIIFFNEAVSFIELARESRQNRQDKIQFSEIVKTVFAKKIEAALLLEEIEPTNKTLENSFYASEKSKAYVLRELLSNAEAKRKTNLHKEILTLEKSINRKLDMLRSQILTETSQKEVDTVKLYALQGAFFDASKQKDSLENSIEAAMPNYYKLKYGNTVITISKLQGKLNASTTLIEFFSTKNALYAFIISKETFHVEKIDVDADLAKLISLMNTSIISKDQATYEVTAENLYSEVIAPLKKYFIGDELIIIPDESLWHLQFDLLLTGKNENKEKPAYLLHDYAISYANSASLLFNESEPMQTSNFANECVAFSFTSTDTILAQSNTIRLADLRNSQIDLPGTRKEIKEISTILDGTYFYGNIANEMNFKKYANTSRVLHLALHGDIDNNNPENLKIYFSKGSPKDDDQLFSHELYSMHIPADLVVLSACNTGNGQVSRAEGIQSLGNAFQYAGTKSLLLSSWEISDKTTPEIMRQFYKNLKEGMPKHKALQSAKIDFLETSDTFSAMPFYWGSFYILGNTAPIPFATANYTIWSIGLTIFVVILLIFIMVKRRSRT
ncbi:CHAT domain-containing tetratricopeptide repeat protein [Kordia sp.]|uniref:CHAT domain-containing protein n=1 Tax=Kordia sp. TaxID=1965332 RepID=UPI0025BA28CC|nr:CHAT domain-containing tetratricopeptide repeat protein [Kordia sp.]MCH2192643.1 CHAT domain-containing protein [Kordia sp.]